MHFYHSFPLFVFKHVYMSLRFHLMEAKQHCLIEPHFQTLHAHRLLKSMQSILHTQTNKNISEFETKRLHGLCESYKDDE